MARRGVLVGRNKRRNGFTILGKRDRREVPACGGFDWFACAAAMPEPRGVASVKIMDAAKRRLFRPTAWLAGRRFRFGEPSDNVAQLTLHDRWHTRLRHPGADGGESTS